MKILVLGNGFDLDHNLPTSYKHFLNFCGYVVYGKILGTDFYKKLTDTQKEYVKKLERKKACKDKHSIMSTSKNIEEKRRKCSGYKTEMGYGRTATTRNSIISNR